MVGGLHKGLVGAVALFALLLCFAGSARAVAIEPPWCGTPEPDAAGALPDGSNPSDPVGSFPHIPYYAIGCTLDAIKAESIGNRMSVRVFGHSALGRPMYLVTINALETPDQRRGFERWSKLRRLALDDPAKAIADLGGYGDDVKVPIFIQAAIHGNEYEGVDASMQLIERLATTPRGADPEVDAILDHAIVVFNADPEPGRPRRRDARQRRRLRPQPGLPDAVAAGGQGLGVGHAGVAVPGHARPARRT